MKLLTRIRLINWHLFENTTIDCQGTTYFIGINGAGKIYYAGCRAVCPRRRAARCAL